MGIWHYGHIALAIWHSVIYQSGGRSPNRAIDCKPRETTKPTMSLSFSNKLSSANASAKKLLSTTIQLSSLSHLVELPVFWYDANSSPMMEWDKWMDLF